ncbi:MAG: response regulator transcription factor [Nitrospira sp.]|nr:response regulator transcription factor [Nitrospira sp.]
MKHRLMTKMFTGVCRRFVMVSISALVWWSSLGIGMAASLHSFNPNSAAPYLAGTMLSSNPSVMEARVTFFHLTESVVELEASVPSVVAEPIALTGHTEGKPDSSFPSGAVLFALVSFGMIGMVSRGDMVSRKSHMATATQPSRSSAARVIGLLSPDSVFAEEIEMQLRQASYEVRTAGSASEILITSDPTSFLLMVVDHRVQDWDMLRTDPLLRRLPLMGAVPRGHLYTEDQCLSDLERGMDGVHDFRDGEGLFLARVHAYARRVDGDAMRRGVYQVGAVKLDADTHEVSISGRAVKLSAKPFAILAALMREPSKIFSRRELVDLVWGRDFAVGGHALDVHIHAVRQQLDREPDHHCRLMTIKGVGFKLKPLSAVNPVVPVAANAGTLRCSVTGRLERVQMPLSESSVAVAKDWRKPSLRRRARELRKPLVAAHRHAAALAG